MKKQFKVYVISRISKGRRKYESLDEWTDYLNRSNMYENKKEAEKAIETYRFGDNLFFKSFPSSVSEKPVYELLTVEIKVLEKC